MSSACYGPIMSRCRVGERAQESWNWPRPPSEAASIAMGGSSSKAAPPQDKPKGFTVRVSKRTTRPSRFHVHPHRLTLSFSPLTLSLHGQMSPAVAQQVQAAVNSFVKAHGDELVVLWVEQQFILRKTVLLTY